MLLLLAGAQLQTLPMSRLKRRPGGKLLTHHASDEYQKSVPQSSTVPKKTGLLVGNHRKPLILAHEDVLEDSERPDVRLACDMF